MDLSQIRYFLNLAETLNFTEAARLSGVSQPALTRAVQRLEEDSSRIRAILDAAPYAIVGIDEEGTIESCNPAAERMFGYTASEAVGANIALLMPSPYREVLGHWQKYRLCLCYTKDVFSYIGLDLCT